MTIDEFRQLGDILKLFMDRKELAKLPNVNTKEELWQLMIDELRLCTEYTLFDLNATRVELEYVKNEMGKSRPAE